MAACYGIKKRRRNVCIGDMDKQIVIQLRTLTPPATDSVDFSEVFTTESTVWAMVETRSGVEIFDGTSLKGIATHYFYIRYNAEYTFENWVLFNEKKYNILDVQNFEEENKFYLLRCSLRGTTNNLANYA